MTEINTKSRRFLRLAARIAALAAVPLASGIAQVPSAQATTPQSASQLAQSGGGWCTGWDWFRFCWGDRHGNDR